MTFLNSQIYLKLIFQKFCFKKHEMTKMNEKNIRLENNLHNDKNKKVEFLNETNQITESSDVSFTGYTNDCAINEVPQVINIMLEELENKKPKETSKITFTVILVLAKLNIVIHFENELFQDIGFEKRLFNKYDNKGLLNKLWNENIYGLLIEKFDPFVEEKFIQRFKWLKEVYFNTKTFDGDEKTEDFNEWCQDKDIPHIFKYMKILSKQIKFKIEAENNLKKELEERKNLEIKYKQIFLIESDEFHKICDNIKMRIVQENQSDFY